MAKPLLDKVLKALEKSDAKYGALVERIMKGGRGPRLNPDEIRQQPRRGRPDDVSDRASRHDGRNDDSDWPVRRVS